MTGSSRSSEKEAFWRLAVEEHRASGLSVRAFCKRESLAEPSFYSWRKKLERRDGERSATRPFAIHCKPSDGSGERRRREMQCPSVAHDIRGIDSQRFYLSIR